MSSNRTVSFKSGLKLNFIQNYYRQNETVISESGKENSEKEEEIEISDFVISLNDILSQRRIEMPVKSANCSHLASFDLTSFMELNKLSQDLLLSKLNFKQSFKLEPSYNNIEIAKKEQNSLVIKISNSPSSPWSSKMIKLNSRSQNKVFKRRAKQVGKVIKCPVCSEPIELTDLALDGFMDCILRCAPAEVKNVRISGDLQYVKFCKEKRNDQVVKIPDIKRKRIVIIDTSDEEDFTGTKADPILIT